MPSWHPASASAGCKQQASPAADAAPCETGGKPSVQAADSGTEQICTVRQVPQPLPPAAGGMPAAADSRPPTGATPVPRSWEAQAQLPGSGTGRAGALTSAFGRLRASPSGSTPASRGGSSGGSSRRTSLLSQQLRGSDSGESAGNSSADSSPLQQSALHGGQPPQQPRPHSRHVQRAGGAGDQPLQRRFAMRSALSAELAGLKADLQQPLQGAQPPAPAAATAGAPLMDAGRSSSTPLPFLPYACPQAGVATRSSASAPFQGWPIGHATPPGRRSSQERRGEQGQAALPPPPPPRPRSMRSRSSPASAQESQEPGSLASACSGYSSPAAPRAREPIAVPGAPVSPPGQWMLGRVPSGDNVAVSFGSDDDNDVDSELGGLSM